MLHMNGNGNIKYAKRYTKKIFSSEAIRGMTLKLLRNVHNIKFYKTFFFVAIALVLSLLWQLKFSINL